MSDTAKLGPLEYVPKGYKWLPDWLTEECQRRGIDHTQKNGSANAQYCRVFDELACYLGQNDNWERKLSIRVTKGGDELDMPLKVWRSDPHERIKVANGWWAARSYDDKARIMVRADLSLDRSMPAEDSNSGKSQAEPRQRAGTKPIWDWERGISAVWAAFYGGEMPPKGRGAQAAIARLLQEKMQKPDGNTPSDTEAKKRASMILNMLTADE